MHHPQDHHSWFLQKVFYWRAVLSLMCLLFLLPIFISGFIFLSLFNPVQPLIWLIEFYRLTFSPSSWFYAAVLGMCISIVMIQYIRQSTVVSTHPKTRLAGIFRLVHPRNLVNAIIHSLTGAVISWCLLAFLDDRYYMLAKLDSDKSTYSLNAHHVFFVLNGLLTGLSCFIAAYSRSSFCITFPVLQQSKFFQVKNVIFSLLYESTIAALWHLQCFYVSYFIFGDVCQSWIAGVMNLQPPTDSPALASLYGLLDVWLFVHSLFCTTFVQFLMRLAPHIYQVYITEPFQFPVESSFEGDKCTHLHQALASFLPLLKNLAFLDLWLLSQQSFSRRKEVFSLSQPGGHPYNWNLIHTECIVVIEGLIAKLTSFNDNRFANFMSEKEGRHLPTSSESVISQPVFYYQPSASSILNDSALASQRSAASPSRVASPYKRSSPLRAGLETPNRYYNTSGAIVTGGVPLYKTWLHYKAFQISERIRNRPSVSYFIKHHPEAESQEIMADMQLYIWTIEALSFLIAASHEEDAFGVVQKDLMKIIAMLIDLHLVLEKHIKLTATLPRRTGKGVILPRTTDKRLILANSLKSSIYRIVSTFHEYLKDVDLPGEKGRKLSLFCQYKE